MNFHHQLIKERFDIVVPTEFAKVRGEFEIDKSARFLIGFVVSSDREELIYLRGSQRIALNGLELFPEGFESKLLMSGLNVSPDERILTIGQLAIGSGKLVVDYKDSANNLTLFEPYRVTIYAFSSIAQPD